MSSLVASLTAFSRGAGPCQELTKDQQEVRDSVADVSYVKIPAFMSSGDDDDELEELGQSK